MDSLTHIVLGACIGEAIAGKQLNKRAMLYGALAQSIPDVDFVCGFFLHGAENVVAHRGFTHSILFALISIAGFAWLLKEKIHKTKLSYRTIYLLLAVNIFTHLFIDTFNTYGIGLFMPFNTHRFSFDILYVADPLFSIAPFISFIFLLVLHKSHHRRVVWIRTGIGIAAFYLCIAVYNKWQITTSIQKQLNAQQTPMEFFTTPSPFNTLLWFVVGREKEGYVTGYRSVFDNHPTVLTYFPKRDSLSKGITNKKDIELLKNFAEGYYTFDKWGDTTVINVLRFGQVVGWYHPKERFAFYYYLNYPANNDMVVQRGRFLKWDKKTIGSLFKRMLGK